MFPGVVESIAYIEEKILKEASTVPSSNRNKLESSDTPPVSNNQKVLLSPKLQLLRSDCLLNLLEKGF
jgi:hypothetical protein